MPMSRGSADVSVRLRTSMRRHVLVLGWIIALGFVDHPFALGAEVWGPFVKKQGGKECLPLKGQFPPYPLMDARYVTRVPSSSKASCCMPPFPVAVLPMNNIFGPPPIRRP